ncbi:MAG: lactonase family protein [Acidobacteriota bacterium]|nr:lactonase family protein [Acidobacteriota bacterium]
MSDVSRPNLRALALALLPAIAGCAGFFVSTGSSSSGSTDFVYVANATTNTVSGFSVGSGALSATSNSPYSLAFQPSSLAINPANTILFVGGNSRITAYSIGSAGALTALNSGSAVAVANVVAMDISPDGQWLFALDGNGVSLDEFQINSTTGVLTQVTGATFSVTSGVVVPRDVKVAPNGAFVFVALGTGGDLVFTLNQTSGAVAASQQLSTPTTTSSDNALAVDASSAYLYVARSGTNGGMAVYTIASGTGALNSVSGSPFSAGTQPYSIVMNKAGTDIYLANRGDSTISGYSVGSGGVLTALSGSPYTSGSSVSALAVERSGKYLLAAASGGSPDLTLYTFDSSVTGKLDLTTTVATGTDPTGPAAIAATH